MRPDDLRPELRPDDLRQPLRRPFRPLTDDEGEVRELTEEDFAEMRPLREVDPGMAKAVKQWRNKGGRQKSETPKVHVGFRLSADVVEAVRASGKGYNVRVDEALREAFVRTSKVAEHAVKRSSKIAERHVDRASKTKIGKAKRAAKRA